MYVKQKPLAYGSSLLPRRLLDCEDAQVALSVVFQQPLASALLIALHKVAELLLEGRSEREQWISSNNVCM